VGGTGYDRGNSVATAADGSVYVAGATTGSIDGQANHGGWDGFFTKYSANGTKQWTQLVGGTGNDHMASSVATGADGSVYVAGHTNGSIDGQANHGGYDGFVTAYAADGTKQWTQLVGSTNKDYGTSVATAADGSVYVAGYTEGSIDGQAFHGNLDGFVTKYAANGTKQWTQLVGGTGTDYSQSVATAADGSVYVAGKTNSSTIDGQANHGSFDGFVTKYSANGTKQWTRLAGGTGGDEVLSVATAADGSVYVAGWTNGLINGQAKLGGYDGFFTKYSADGAKQWTQVAGGSGDDIGTSVATAADGSVYIAGYTSSASIDGQANHGGYWDSFVIKYAANDTKQWAQLVGGTGNDMANSVATAANGSVYIAGMTDSSTIDGQANNGNFDTFVTKLVVT
jgi:hypothetical protein